MNAKITLTINQQVYQVDPGLSVAAALAYCGVSSTRLSVSGMPRAPLCGMGICQECRVTIDGNPHQLACQTLCCNDMTVLTGVLA